MRIRIHPAFYLYLFFVWILSSGKMVLCMLIALLIHESGHYVVSRITGEQIEQLELTPFGGVMTYKYASVSHKGVRGLCVHAAGPLSNYIAVLVLSASLVRNAMDRSVLRMLITANVSMFSLNILPVLPLDGGRMVFCIGYYLFPVAKLVFALSALGILAGGSFALLAMYGLVFHKTLNCSLLIIGIHMILSARSCRSSLLAENMYSVIQERMSSHEKIQRIHTYRVASDTLLFDLVPILSKSTGAVSFVFDCGQEDGVLQEKAFCHFLLKEPSTTIMQAFSDLQKEKKFQKIENASFTP